MERKPSTLNGIMKFITTLALLFAAATAISEPPIPTESIETILAIIMTEKEFFADIPVDPPVDEDELETRARKFKKYADIPGLGRYMFMCEENDGPCDAILIYSYRAPVVGYSSWRPRE